MKAVVLVLLAAHFSLPAAAQYLTNVVAGGGTGSVTASDNGIPATDLQELGELSSIAFDSAGNVYAADERDSLILKIGTDGNLTIVAGVPNYIGFYGDGAPAPDAWLYNSGSIVFDSSGNLYIADSGNNRIRKIGPDGIISTIAGIDAPLGPNNSGFAGDGGLAINAELNGPTSVAVGNGNIYTADFGNCRVRKIDTSGVISTIAGQACDRNNFTPTGDGGPAIDATFSPFGPAEVAADNFGNVYVMDLGFVRKIDATGTINTIPGIKGAFNISVDSAGNLYTAGFITGVVLKVAPDGTVTTVAGGTGPNALYAVCAGADSTGTVYVCLGLGRGAIARVNADGTLTTIAGAGDSFYNTPRPANSVILPIPADVATAPDGGFYVSTSTQIFKVSQEGLIQQVIGPQAGISGAGGLATDSSGVLYFADSNNSRILKLDLGGNLTTIAGSGVAGFSGDGGPAAAAQLNMPQGVAVDLAGNIYISDSLNHCIRRVNPQGVITTIAGTGQAGFSGDGGPDVAAQLSTPSRLALDAAGNLYIADSFVPSSCIDFDQCAATPGVSNQRIRKIDSNGIITTVAGNGTAGYSGDGGPAVAASLFFPQGIAVDAAGNLYILDTVNNAIRMVDSSGTISTLSFVMGGGTVGLDLSLEDFYAQAGGGIAVDLSGTLYIADYLSQFVLKATRVTTTSIVSAVPAASLSAVSFPVAQNAPAMVANLYGPASPVAPGSLVTVLGINLSTGTNSASVPLPFTLGGTSVTINGIPAPILSAYPDQITLQVPFDAPLGAVTLAVQSNSGSAIIPITIASVAPVIFRFGGEQGIVTDSRSGILAGTCCSPPGGRSEVPAYPGQVVTIFCTGLGDVTNRPANGAASPFGPSFAETLATPTVTIGGIQTQPLYSGLSPGSVGVYQINAAVPMNVPLGPQIPVTVAVGSASDTVTISIQ